MKTKKIWIGAAALGGAAVLTVGGLATAFASDSGNTKEGGGDQQLSGSTLDQASAAAIKAAGGGTVTDSSQGDESDSAYEVEVTTTNGKQVDIHLDKNFAVLTKETDTENDQEKALTGDVLTQASAAAIKAAGGGTVTGSSQGDGSGSAYDVEVTTSDGKQVDIHLDKNFAVVKTEADGAN